MEIFLIVFIIFGVSILVAIGGFFLRELFWTLPKKKSEQTTTTFTSTAQSGWYSTNDEYGWAYRRGTEPPPGVWVSYREIPEAQAPEVEQSVKAEAEVEPVKKLKLKSRFELLKEKDHD